MTDTDLVEKKLAFGFRNVVVHGYQHLDQTIVVDVVRNRLGDLLAFCSAIRARLHPTSGAGP
jgi:uncharacterized protein YutE (UPF0331/DUF86 family)